MTADHIEALAAPLVVTLTAALGGSALLAEAEMGPLVELRLAILPFIGSTMVALGLILINSRPETRRKVAGRAILASAFASTLPGSMALLWPSLNIITSHPLLLLDAGGLICAIAYPLAGPLVSKLFARSDKLADQVLDLAEKKVGLESPNPPQ